MKMHVIGQSVLGELRQQVLALLTGHPLFTAAEQLRANHFAHECEDAARLTRWHVSVEAEISRREQAAAHQQGRQALSATLRQLRPIVLRSYLPRRRHPAPWAPGAPLPDRTDRRVGTFDRRAAARFQPADSLTFACLTAPARS